MHFLNVVLSIFVAFAATTAASPVPIASSPAAVPTAHPTTAKSLLVVRPKILTPQKDDVWTVGSTVTVTWETTKIPDEKRKSTGLLLLARPTPESENLDINNPLATQFPIIDGRVSFVVPNVARKGEKHAVVLFGDSGNLSAEFTIVAPVNPSSSSKPTTVHKA